MMLVKFVILLIAVVCGFFTTVPVHGAFKFSRNGKIQMMPNINERSLSDTPPACNLTIDQSTLKELLILTSHQGKNAIKLNVWVESVNNISDKTQFLPGIIWANKMGRTLVSLIVQTESIQKMILSPYTSTLAAGVDGADVVISKAPKGCLLPKNNTADTVFRFLLHQLRPIDKDNDDFQLCSRKLKNERNYNCCGIHGQSSVLICSEFSSFLTELPTNLFLVATWLFIYISLPLIVDHLNYPHTESEYYKISDNPMSLSSILRIIFIQGHGPLKSFGRKLVTTTAILAIGLPVWDLNDAKSVAIYTIVCTWAVIYLFFDFPFLSAEMLRHRPNNVRDNNPFLYLICHISPIKIITIPFNLKFVWNAVNRWPFFKNHFKLCLNTATSAQQSTQTPEITEHTTLLSQPGEPQTSPAQHGGRLEVFKYRLSIVFLLISYFVIGFLFLGIFSLSFLVCGRYFWQPLLNVNNTKCKRYVQYGMRFVAFFILIVSFVKCLVLTFFFSTGMYLNAKYYSAYFVPLSIVLFYSWSKWRSSIETKYMELTMRIYEVCKESVPLQMTENTGTDDIPGTSTSNLNERFKILLDDNGEPIIPKQLYDTIRETFLPYNEVLFHYFEGVVLVTIFSVFLYIMMSLAQTSGLSDVVQIISTMAATSFPFIFDVVWKKCSLEQKAADTLSLKSKLKKVLVVHSHDTVTGEILVEFTGTKIKLFQITGKDITIEIRKFSASGEARVTYFNGKPTVFIVCISIFSFTTYFIPNILTLLGMASN